MFATQKVKQKFIVNFDPEYIISSSSASPSTFLLRFYRSVVAKCNVSPSTSLKELKVQVQASNKKWTIHRQALRLEVRGKTLKDSDTIESLGLRGGSKIFVKDLGPQIGWSTVFLAEYAGPLLVYLWVYQRPWLFYGDTTTATLSTTAQ